MIVVVSRRRYCYHFAASCENVQAVLSFKGGETEALKRVKHYLWDTDCVADYFNTRNGMLGGDYSTK